MTASAGPRWLLGLVGLTCGALVLLTGVVVALWAWSGSELEPAPPEPYHPLPRIVPAYPVEPQHPPGPKPPGGVASPRVSVQQDDLDAEIASGTEADIRSSIARRASSFRSCTDAARKAAPDVTGRITVAWAVTSGKVSDVHLVTNTTGSDELGFCFTAVVRALRFPEQVTAEVGGFTQSVPGG